MALNCNSSCFSTALSVCLEFAIVSELNILGGCDSYVAGVALEVGGANDLGTVEGYLTRTINVNVSGILVTFGFAFYGDVAEIEIAGTVDEDLA